MTEHDGRRWLDYVPLSSLNPDPRNPKNHNLDDLRQSTGRFGYTEPVMVDERTGLLVSGHGRRELLLADRAAGAAPPDGVVVEDGEWLVPLIRGWQSANDDEAGAYLIAANELTMKGGWKPDPLVALLDQLHKGPGLLGTGYTPTRLQDLLLTIGPPPSLADLQSQYGSTSADDFWPTIHFKVAPGVRERYLALLAHGPAGDDEQARFTWLLDLAEVGLAAVAAADVAAADVA